MMKCKGCGAILQNNNSNEVGYTKDLNKDYCERCFRIKNYNEYHFVDKDNTEYLNIIKQIGKTDSLVILVIDLFNIGRDLSIFEKYLSNNILLVLTKRDLLPLSIYDKNIENYFDDLKLNIVDKVIISSKNNYNYDLLYSKINKYKTKETYVVGFTNSGKSSMINKILYNYSNEKLEITTSYLPSTTLDTIEIRLDDYKLIDTPGLLEEGNILNYVNKDLFSKIIPKSEIKPKNYQIKGKQSLIINDILRLDVEDNNVIFYISNNLDIDRFYKDVDKLKELKKHRINITEKSDIVINGLGFLSVLKPGVINIYLPNDVLIYIRKSLI